MNWDEVHGAFVPEKESDMKGTSRSDLCTQASQIISVDRNAQYGEPEDNFSIIASLWSDYIGAYIDAHDVAIMMTLFKIGRIKSGGTKKDNYVDAIGYMACAGEIELTEKVVKIDEETA